MKKLLLSVAAALFSTAIYAADPTIYNYSINPTGQTAAVTAGRVFAAPMTITPIQTVAGSSQAKIKGISVVDTDEKESNFKLYIFKATTSNATLAVNTAPSFLDSYASNFVAVVDVPSANYVDMGAQKVYYTATDIAVAYSTGIYIVPIQMSADRAYTTSSDVKFQFQIEVPGSN